ncbi:hypothetical protein GGH93_001147 [Coemansia aciculifera]|nr:hypothetical protein GGH93_001147 [Coemansia aciculifera]
MLSELASITHGAKVPCSPIARLAYHNACTLKELHIAPTAPDDWSSLIRCGHQAPVAYTSLASLSMDITKSLDTRSWTTVKGVVPFPVLSQLDISGAYPFADDALFRGNRGMLHRLSIPFSAIAKNALGRFNVLERNGITWINPIHTVQISGTPWFAPSDNFVREQVHGILKASTTLQLGCDTSIGLMLTALCTAPNTAILQHLTLSDKRCALADIISIVYALTSLVSLTSQVCGVGMEIGLIPENEHPSTLYETYYPLSSSFRKLRVPSVANADIGRVSIVAMQIAIVCPSFAYVDLPYELCEEFRDSVTWSTNNDLFKSYGDALRRLM